jgi:hypothetical protein
MKRATTWSSVLLVIAAGGCGGGGGTGFLRDGINVYSELVDSMGKIVDEPSVQKFTNIEVKRLNEKWETLKKRLESFIRFGDEKDVDQLAFLWLAEALHNKGKSPGPVAAMLKSQASPLTQRIEKMLKKMPGWEGKEGLNEQDLTGGRVVVKQAAELMDQKSIKHLFNESAAARALFDQQLKRIKALRPQEPYAALDLKVFTGEQ